jgi:hypothetical protein
MASAGQMGKEAPAVTDLTTFRHVIDEMIATDPDHAEQIEASWANIQRHLTLIAQRGLELDIAYEPAEGGGIGQFVVIDVRTIKR